MSRFVLPLLVVCVIGLVLAWLLPAGGAPGGPSSLQPISVQRELLTEAEAASLLVATSDPQLAEPTRTTWGAERARLLAEPVVVTVTVRASSARVPESTEFRVVVSGPTTSGGETVTKLAIVGVPLSLEVGKAGRYSIRAAADGYFCDTAWVHVRQAEPAAVELLAEPGMKISGQVRTQDRVPVGGATILVTEGFGATLAVSTRAKSDGSFEMFVPQSKAGIRNELLVLAEGFQPLRKRDGIRFDGLDLVMKEGVELPGIVRTVDSEPVAGASVSWRLRGRQPASVVRWLEEHPVSTNARGEFLLTGVHSAEVQLSVVAEGFAPEKMRLRSSDVEEPVVVLLSSGSQLRGRVIDHLGDPVSGARIEVNDAQEGRSRRMQFTVSDAEGSFEVEGLASGEFLVLVEAAGRAPLAQQINLPRESDLVLSLQESATLSGSVRGAPDSGYRVSIQSTTLPRVRLEEDFQSVEFMLEDLPEGTFEVLIAGEGRPNEPAGSVTLSAGQTARLDYALSTEGGEIVGEMLNSNGAAPNGARLTLFMVIDPSTGNRETVATQAADRDGSFRFAGLSSGEYSLLASSSDGASQLLTKLMVEENGALNVGVVTVAAGASVRILVLDKKGRPLASKSVSVSDGQTGFTSRTSDEGMAVVENLRPGRCSATISVDGVPLSVHGDTFSGELTELVLEAATQQLSPWSGRVQYADGRPSGEVGLRAVATDVSWVSDSVQANANGAFELNGQFTGDFILELHSLPGATAMRQVIVSPSSGSEYPKVIVLPGGSITGQMPGGCAHVILSFAEWTSGAFGEAVARRGGTYAKATTTPGGTFEIPFLPSGSYEVGYLNAAREEMARKSVSVQATSVTVE